MRGCSVHYHETVDLTDSVDSKLIDPPKISLRNYEEDIEELVSSVREKGLIQPILIRPTGDRFEVVAGARRLEACKRLRWGRIPCIIRELSDKRAYEISLTENIQRKTMNAVEEAKAFRLYIDQNGWGSESQLAHKIGKSQEYVSQRLSILSLSKNVQQKIIRHQINPSVAQEIARLPDPQVQKILSEEAVKHGMTVGMIRDTAKSVKQGVSIQSAIRQADLKRKLAHTGGQIISDESLEDIMSISNSDASEPDFVKDQKVFGPSRSASLRAIEKAILVLKLALSRMGSLIDEMPEDSEVKDMLLEKRLVIHNMIDSLIKSKIKLGYRVDDETEPAITHGMR
ncbi:MAG TPA: ParB/RepB/Spo0J family partition protein [Nitrososphaerales archaeon]|nr:ParB/RepB/Spo0J family partition protein [Nitrososphaerales archaeon]